MLQITVAAFSCNIQTFCTVSLIHEALCVNTCPMSCMKIVSKILCFHLNYYFFYSIKALSFLGPNSTHYYEVGRNVNHNKISNLGFKESRQFSPVWPLHWLKISTVLLRACLKPFISADGLAKTKKNFVCKQKK